LTSLRSRGFTLVELLVAGLIASLVLIAIYVVFIANTTQYYRQEQIVQMQESMRFAVEYLKNDMRNVGRNSIANGVASFASQPDVTDAGYCGTTGVRGVQLFDNEQQGGPAVLEEHGNGLRPDRLRMMVDTTGGTQFAVSTLTPLGQPTVIRLERAGAATSAAAAEILGAEAAFEATFKPGYYLRLEDSNAFTLLPIEDVDYNGGSPTITVEDPVRCGGFPSWCLAGECRANPVQHIEYRLVADGQPNSLKTDLVRQAIHSINDEPILAERVVVAEYIVNMQLWGIFDTRNNGSSTPVIPADATPKDDIGNWSEDTEAQRFNSRPERIRKLHVLLARRTAREDEELTVAPGMANAPEERVAADLTWFDLDGEGEPDRTTGLARVATLHGAVETPNLVVKRKPEGP